MSTEPVPRETVKLITCVLNDEQNGKRLLSALKQRNIIRANSINCRGFASLAEVDNKDKLPEPRFVKLIEVIVSEAEADEVFDFIYEEAGIGEPAAGTIFMTALLGSSQYSLPENIPDEE